MTILAALPNGTFLPDVCVVGTGPVGLAVALECERLGLSVLALEAGGATARVDQLEARPRADVVDPSRHAPLHVTMRQAFGGTSWGWPGACVPFDAIDFEPRPHVAESGWPIKHDDVEPYYARAAQILDCDPPIFQSGTDTNAVIFCSARFSRRPQLGLVHRERIERSKTITVCLNCSVVSLDLSATGERIDAVTVATPDGPAHVKARHVVIAAGGLRSTQLLLAAQRHWPRHFGGVDGPLGRYYMGHLTGWISAIQFPNKAEAARFQATTIDGRPHALQRLAIAAPAQLSECLLNTSFWPTNVAFFDPSHGSAVLSAAFLTLMLPMGRILMPAALRRASLGPTPADIWGHFWNVISDPTKTASTVMAAIWRKFIHHEELGDFLKQEENGSYLLWYHAEHAPHPDSRVSLTQHVDNLGLPSMRIDLRYSPGDVEAVIKAHRILDTHLKAHGLGSLAFLADEPSLPGRVLEQARDGYHQMGTTRMGSDPRTSVVDRDCQVHGVSNLHVAASSVFPTSGQANPTLLAAALAVRLANRIATRLNEERAGSVACDAILQEGKAAELE